MRPEGGGAVEARRQHGDTSAFEEVYRGNVDAVFRYALFRVGDRRLAEDITGETFVRALREHVAPDRDGGVRARLLAIARTITIDHLRSTRHRLEVSVAHVDDALAGPTAAADGPEHQALAAAWNAELMLRVAKLSPDQRDCVVLRFLHGLSVAETAAVMGRNQGAIKALQHRAVRRLAVLMDASRADGRWQTSPPTPDATEPSNPEELERRESAALVDDLAAALDLHGGLDDVLRVADQAALTHHLAGLLDLPAGLNEALAALDPDQPGRDA